MVLLATAGIVSAQTPLPVEISYDAAGNRITRKVLRVSMTSKGGYHTDSSFYSDIMQSVQLRVYPNPTQGKIYIEMLDLTEDAPNKVRIFDNQGKLIYKNEGLGNAIEIDISRYPTGYYMVELHTNGEHTTWKIIKQ